MFQQGSKKERSKSAILSAPANMISFRAPAASGSSSSSGITGNSNNQSSTNGGGAASSSSANANNSSSSNSNSKNQPHHQQHQHANSNSTTPAMYQPTAPLIGAGPAEQWFRVPRPTTPTPPVERKPHSSSSSQHPHIHQLVPAPDPQLLTSKGVPQSRKAPTNPSSAPGVSFRSSLKPHHDATIPDIPYGSGQGQQSHLQSHSQSQSQGQQQGQQQGGRAKRSVSISSSAVAPSHASTATNATATGGKARIFTPSDTQKGIRVLPQEAEKKNLQDNTAQNAAHNASRSSETTNTIIASSAQPSTHLYTPSAPLTVNAPIVPAGPQLSTLVDSQALEHNLRDATANAAANGGGGGGSGRQLPKSALKGHQARSWADLVRPMNNVKLAQHTLANLGLPEEQQKKDPAADAAIADMYTGERRKKVSIALPGTTTTTTGSNATAGSGGEGVPLIPIAPPSKTGATGGAADKSPKHTSQSLAEQEDNAAADSSFTGHHQSSDARSIKSTGTHGTQGTQRGSILDSYVSKKSSLEEILQGVENSRSAVLLYPRGLVNTGNACFMNSILQTLLFTSPFYNLISLIGANTSEDLGGKTPLLDAMVSYLSEFKATKDNAQDREQYLKSGEGYEDEMSGRYRDAFIPSIIYHALNHNQRFAQMGFYNPAASTSAPSSLSNGMKGGNGTSNAPISARDINSNSRLSQEDAHEFLGFFLDTIHEELILKIQQHDSQSWQKASKGYKAGTDILSRQSVNSIAGINKQNNSSGASTKQEAASQAIAAAGITPPPPATATANGGDDSSDWLEVGQKGRTATTRTTEHQESAVTKIFGGQLRSVLRCPGQKDSVTLEPYTSLQLEIHQNGVQSITDALSLIASSETISDMTNHNNMLVEATKQVFIESLPPVLILHLKRFNYDPRAGGVVKSHKLVTFETEFEVPKDCVAPSRRITVADGKRNRYKLTGVVYHHGKTATGGHYSVTIRQSNGRWVNIDDTTITPVPAEEVATDRDRETMRLSLPSASSLRGVPEKSAYLLFYQRV